jgi:hypothetical protein
MASDPRPPGQMMPDKEPLVTGHSSHADLVEEARIGWEEARYGTRAGFRPLALLYLFVLSAAVLLLWWAFGP